MSVIHFIVNWPDGDAISYCAPSTLILDYLFEGTIYNIREFDIQSRKAMHAIGNLLRNRDASAYQITVIETARISSKIDQLSRKAITGPVRISGLSEWDFSDNLPMFFTP